MARRRLGFWRRFVVVTVKPLIILFTKRDWRGMEHIPKSGGAIIVANHLSHADPLTSAHYIYDAGRWPQFLAKSSLFTVPVLGFVLRKVRQIPVYRSTAVAARALTDAVEAINRGDAVIIYPEGTTTREPDLWPMRGKTGAARLALTTGVPVIPLVMWGPQRLFDPRTKKLRLRVGTPVTVVAGPPMDLSKWTGATPTPTTLHEMTDHIMLHLRDMLAEIRDGTPPELWTPRRSGGEDID